MGQIPAYYANVLRAIGDNLKKTLQLVNEEDVQLVQKGFLLYRQGRVSKIKVDKESTTAVVDDVASVQVELNHGIFPLSTCTCPHEGICRHQVAVFFHVYSRIGKVSQWIDEWKASARLNQLAKNLGLARAVDAKGAKGALAEKSPGAQALDYKGWIGEFERGFESIVTGNAKGNPQVLEQLFGAYLAKMKRSAPFRQGWKELYELALHVRAFGQLLRVGDMCAFSKAEMEEFVSPLAGMLMKRTEEILGRMNLYAVPLDIEQTFGCLMDDVRRVLLLERDLWIDERIRLYLLLWSRLFVKKAWHEEEERKLKEIMKEKRSLPLLMGFVHQEIMLGKDEAAIGWLRIAGAAGVRFLPDWLAFLLERKAFQRMNGYIGALLSGLKAYMAEMARKNAEEKEAALAGLFQIIRKHGEETGSSVWLEKAFLAALPGSFEKYREYLLANGNFEKWCDLHLLLNKDADAVPEQDKALLEEKAPHALLPLYHQAVEKHISIRNRANYRTAAAYLCRLRALYEKLGGGQLWDEYFRYVLDKTRRLSAFNEECRRCGLIGGDGSGGGDRQSVRGSRKASGGMRNCRG